MTMQEFHEMTVFMQKYGGSFIASLAIALRYADPYNRQRLLTAFPEIVEKYGPTSTFQQQSNLVEV